MKNILQDFQSLLIPTEREVHGISVNQLGESVHFSLAEQLRQLVCILAQYFVVTMNIEMRNSDPVCFHCIKYKSNGKNNINILTKYFLFDPTSDLAQMFPS